jgi:hypothetical protein
MAENGDATLPRALNTRTPGDTPATAKVRQARMNLGTSDPVLSAAMARLMLLADEEVPTVASQGGADGPWLHFNPTWALKASAGQIQAAIEKAVRGDTALMQFAERAQRQAAAL